MSQAVELIEAMTVEWDPANYEDRYRKRLEAIVRKKRKGGEIEIPKADPDEASPAPDLMRALEESLAGLSR